MDASLKTLMAIKINQTIDALKKNQINAYHISSIDALHSKITELVPENSLVSFGGSMTLFETKTLDYLRKKNYRLLDRYAPNLSKEAIGDLYRQSFSADAYFTSTNALLSTGALYNVDGNGNRVAAMIYGPKKVIVITSASKIVPDLDTAIKRNREVCAPANVLRLNRNTPCKVTGSCMDCKSPERVCNSYSLINGQSDPNRMHVLILDEHYGY